MNIALPEISFNGTSEELNKNLNPQDNLILGCLAIRLTFEHVRRAIEFDNMIKRLIIQKKNMMNFAKYFYPLKGDKDINLIDLAVLNFPISPACVKWTNCEELHKLE